jgi:hypothetical protein
LLDLLAASPEPPRVGELRYCFRERQHGETRCSRGNTGCCSPINWLAGSFARSGIS